MIRETPKKKSKDESADSPALPPGVGVPVNRPSPDAFVLNFVNLVCFERHLLKQWRRFRSIFTDKEAQNHANVQGREREVVHED